MYLTCLGIPFLLQEKIEEYLIQFNFNYQIEPINKKDLIDTDWYRLSSYGDILGYGASYTKIYWKTRVSYYTNNVYM